MIKHTISSALVWTFLWLAAPLSHAAEADVYLRHVKPLLKARCLACHGALQQKAGLRVDTAAAILKGSDSGPAIIAGDVAKSPLIERVEATDLAVRMPPDGKPLTPEEMGHIKAWIAAGAPGPANETPEPDPREHWAFQVPRKAAIPPANGKEAGHPIDAFLLAKLDQEGLTPRPFANPEVQLRRLYLDMIGLPPTAEELQAFLADTSSQAWETVVDRLLQDPRYGERWGRHWMDVWRYSDWYGRRQENDVRNSASQIWRWRDWIVNSLNADHGYDRMLQEMLAADEIRPDDEEAAVATGYIIRNFYSLNANDWMRNVVEHTGKAFLGLTFNCAHCHDHKYDPITQDNYFQLRAVFEPVYVRQDRVAGETDPGMFQDYDYAGLRKVQRLGLVRIFDKLPDAPTWFYTGGDERNRVKERGSIPPGVPQFLTGSSLNIQAVNLPMVSVYPGLRPGIQQTVLKEAASAVQQAEQELKAAQELPSDVSPEALAAVRDAELALETARKDAAPMPPLVGQQSLLFDATTGRRIVYHPLSQLKELPDKSVLEFQVRLINDVHFNFQFTKDLDQGLTAGYIAWEKGRIVSYQPGGFTEFEVAKYDFAAGQQRFQVRMKLDLPADRCLLTIRSLADDKVLAEQTPIALNGWNPVGNPKKPILFDARTGSVAEVDEIVLSAPTVENTPAQRLASFGFEPPVYSNGRDVGGTEGWIASAASVAPAISEVTNVGPNAALRELSRKVDSARRLTQIRQIRIDAAHAKLDAARAELSAVEARIAADVVRYGEIASADAMPLARTASRREREASVKKSEADMLASDFGLLQAEMKPAADANRAKEIDAATKKLAAARTTRDQAAAALANESLAQTYTGFSATFPATSTGRRRALAEWITNRQHPLTARVAVNHIWSRHFHAPLVSSVYDFGRNGAQPTHPELLDWLAVELMEHQWSMKHLHRLIVTSAAYRRVSSVGDAAGNVTRDPENKFFWRMNAGRMEAEVVRDSLLFCAGKLDLTPGGQELENKDSLMTFRRTLYYSIHPEGGGKGPLGELFDAPDPLECYRRTRSIIPQQALALTNSDLIHQMAAAIVAENKIAPAETDGFITAMFRKILSRQPTNQEIEICRESLSTVEGVDVAKARESLVRALFNHNDFVTIR